ncbi:major histocompatibility complex class I-related gene protein-like isoform X1 [Channa argus]|uniref:major histocompatibility complex class I-related gene protein-like isoform X1 n=1 Tax=Channa argus TaxID=215402 RepID=UPI00352080BD
MLQEKMKTLLALSVILLGTHGAAAVTHSLKYFYTGSSGIPSFPDFLTVGLVDGQPISYYDSVIRKVIPKQDWMAQTEGPEYWESETQASIGAEPVFKGNIDTAKQRFNQTGGVHIVQVMFGCDWDDETDEVTGYHQEGYDGEDFIVFDLKTETWIAPKPEAVITKLKWDNDKARIAQRKNYLTQICPEWVKKYVNYGSSSLLRTDLPSVSVLQKTPSSPVSCHATGFYPDRATMFWSKDGQELHEDVDHGEILSNHDGTFQMTVDLNISSVKPEDWRRYDCVFQLYGVKDDIITKLDKAVRINAGSSESPVGAIIGVVVGLFILAVCIAGVFIWRGRTSNVQRRPPRTVKSW